MAKDGIHAVVLVFSTRGRFSEEEQATFLTLKALFGSKIVDYMLVLFTGGDDLEDDGKTLDNYCLDCPAPLQVFYYDQFDQHITISFLLFTDTNSYCDEK